MPAAGRRGPTPGAPARFISLTTDFGLSDPFAGLVRAQVLRRCPTALVVDLTHAITPQRVEEAAFWLERSWRYFPDGTLHLAIVDPGVGGARGLLAVRAASQLFLGPDNGVLGGVAALPRSSKRSVSEKLLGQLGLMAAGATFHGRDLLGPLAGELAAGRVRFEDLGPVARRWVARPGPDPRVVRSGVIGRVVLVDHFGNCFSNIDTETIKSHEVTCIRFGGHELPLVRTYADRPAGTDIALLNAFGVLEAARVMGCAAAALGLQPGSRVEVRWKDASAPRAGPLPGGS